MALLGSHQQEDKLHQMLVGPRNQGIQHLAAAEDKRPAQRLLGLADTAADTAVAAVEGMKHMDLASQAEQNLAVDTLPEEDTLPEADTLPEVDSLAVEDNLVEMDNLVEADNLVVEDILNPQDTLAVGDNQLEEDNHPEEDNHLGLRMEDSSF